MATIPNLSYHTLIIEPQKLGKRRNVVNRKASTIQRAVKKLNHVVGELEDANVSDILQMIINYSNR
jgi:isopropylmalate/homocitrate/citramalate synthase